ncbi:RagB/SusD family nutrient uptake outer membrane protein [Flavicella sediminum]|uniref:RagB/SusD family nutrient uptake outer membrane protein n=1 Tax=Flavicella sediminum TaxID=2585141 RepID=UPI00140D1498|nr:RagB/SusD family nutrient uptake outer membrane protein [Flavicella sediminum]
MKNILKLPLSILTMALLFSSCEDFLTEEPQSTLGVDDFYSSEIEAEIAIAGIYSPLASDKVYGQNMTVSMESGTDEGYYNRRYNENWTVGLYRHTPADNDIKDLWSGLYSSINLSNLFIEKLNKDAFELALYNQYIAEARFLRALSYALLVDWFEEVPLSLKSTQDQSSNHLAPASLETLYEQIIADFIFASEHLPKANDPNYVVGRANKMAAHGLMARVYLKMAGYPLNDTSKYPLAKEQCEVIINDPDQVHGLNQSTTELVAATETTEEKRVVTVDGYRKHFLSYIENEYDVKESIFEISFSYLRELGIDTHGRIGGINGLAFGYGGGDDGYPGAYAMFNASPILNDLYVANNDSIRKQWNVPAMQYTNNGDARMVTSTLAANYCPGKFRRWEPSDYNDLFLTPEDGVIEAYTLLEANPTPNKNFTGVNFPVLRYADVLLMFAEAENEINNGPTALAIDALDQVRARAGVSPIAEKVGATANKTNFFNELVDERLRELCFEGLRKHDLIRWNLLGEKLNQLNETIKGSADYSSANENHNAFLRSGEFFDPAKHMSLPYPLQEVQLNNNLDQKSEW